MNTLENIISQSVELFSKFGIRSVTMDDIASRIGVSKKTLYAHVQNKQDLVRKGIELFLRNECQICDQITKDYGNAIEEMVEIGRYVSQHIAKFNPSLSYDLQKYYSVSWQLVSKHKSSYVYSKIKQNLEKGKEQGLYRANLDPEMVARFYIYNSDIVIDHSIFPIDKFSRVDIFWEFIRYHLSGICSGEGLEYLQQYLKKEKRVRNA